MPTSSYDDFRRVLRKLGFILQRAKKHEWWVRRTPDGRTYRVPVSRKRHQDIPRLLFNRMLRQVGIDEQTFRNTLRDP